MKRIFGCAASVSRISSSSPNIYTATSRRSFSLYSANEYHGYQQADEKLVADLAQIPITVVPLKQLIDFGENPTDATLLNASKYLHHEVPVRLAKRIVELSNLPRGFSEMKSIQQIRKLYLKSLMEIYAFPKLATSQDDVHFTDLMKSLFRRHSGVEFYIARAIYELRESYLTQPSSGKKANFVLHEDWPEIQKYIDDFVSSRIGLRVLIGQHIALHEYIEGYIGIICKHTSPKSVADAAIAAASEICKMHYNRAPNVIIDGHIGHVFPYVPSHLHFILYELLKNSMRATMESHGTSGGAVPDIQLIIADGENNEDVCIKLSDEGGGILRSDMKKVWSYTYTTASEEEYREIFKTQSDLSYFSNDAEHPMAGLGIGLPLSRMHAKYFNGNIELISMEGYGTDAYCYFVNIK